MFMKLNIKQFRKFVKEAVNSSNEIEELAQLQNSGDILSYKVAGYYDNITLVFPSGKSLTIRAEYNQYEEGGDVEPVLDFSLS